MILPRTTGHEIFAMSLVLDLGQGGLARSSRLGSFGAQALATA